MYGRQPSPHLEEQRERADGNAVLRGHPPARAVHQASGMHLAHAVEQVRERHSGDDEESCGERNVENWNRTRALQQIMRLQAAL
jgi:hypothetical protein